MPALSAIDLSEVADRLRGALPNIGGREREAVERMLLWINTARPNQLQPFSSDSADIWISSGRGWGKTKTLTHWVLYHLIFHDHPTRIALVGRSGADVRENLLEGDDGIMHILPKNAVVQSNKQDQSYRLWNGSYFRLFSSEMPNSLRGPNFHYGAGDETSSWRYLEALTNLELCVRLGLNPQKLHTTTPKRNDITRFLNSTQGIEVIRGGTMENKDNLSSQFISRVYERYDGTHLARQELHGELVDESPGALFTSDMIDRNRVKEIPANRYRCVVAIDPQAIQSKEEEHYDLGSETGIVCAMSVQDDNDGQLHFYVIADGTVRGRPSEWAAAAHRLKIDNNADYYVAEVNQGGDMVTEVIRHADQDTAVRAIHQQKGKRVRAEAISLLYEKNLVHHVGNFPELEDQMRTWTGFPSAQERSPDRLDAVVLAIAELMVDSGVSSPFGEL